MELDKQAPGIGRVRKGDDQSAKVDGVAPSTGWEVDSGNMLIWFQMRESIVTFVLREYCRLLYS